VVPENIHTPPTEGFFQFEPPPPRIFHSRGLKMTSPHPLEFPAVYSYTSDEDLKQHIIYGKLANNNNY